MGRDIYIQKKAKSIMQDYQVRMVLVQGKRFQVLWYEVDDDQCEIHGPVAEPRKHFQDDECVMKEPVAEAEESRNIAANKICAVAFTPVVCRGLTGDSLHLN